MARKVSGVSAVLALAGFVWLLGLCFSSPSATYRQYGSLDGGVTVKCEPLIDPGREPRDPQQLLTDEQQDVVQRYRDYEKQSTSGISDERLDQLQATAEQVILAGCESARLDRLANIGFIAFLTVVPLLIAVRPGPASRSVPAGDAP